MTGNEITYQIRGAIFDVYNELTYLRLLDKRTGLLVNFSDENIRDGIQRIVN